MNLHELGLLILLLVVIGVFVLGLIKQLAWPVAFLIGATAVAIFFLVGVS